MFQKNYGSPVRGNQFKVKSCSNWQTQTVIRKNIRTLFVQTLTKWILKVYKANIGVTETIYMHAETKYHCTNLGIVR